MGCFWGGLARKKPQIHIDSKSTVRRKNPVCAQAALTRAGSCRGTTEGRAEGNTLESLQHLKKTAEFDTVGAMGPWLSLPGWAKGGGKARWVGGVVHQFPEGVRSDSGDREEELKTYEGET